MRAHFLLILLFALSLGLPRAGFAKLPCSEFASLTVRAASDVIGPQKNQIAYPGIPSVSALHLPSGPPQIGLTAFASLSPGISDPFIEEARQLKVFDDFKVLSDAIPKNLTEKERVAIYKQAMRTTKKRSDFLCAYLNGVYDFRDELTPAVGAVRPEWKLDVRGKITSVMAKAFAYTERLLPTLVRKTPEHSRGSLLPSPYPVLIAAPGRFHESYYWDSYFGMKGLLATGRLEPAQWMVENFLHAIQQYGHIPNGMRDYYLSRSQPPFISSMVREVYDASMKAAKTEEERDHLRRWLKERAYPLLKHDYEDFWMNPETRYDKKTGLNHHWDDLNIERQERHAFDDEKGLGVTYRAVRAAAESGEDFTVAHEGDATNVAPVLLNSMLYKTETDLAWISKETGDTAGQKGFVATAAKRKRAMDRYLWNNKLGRYENYYLGGFDAKGKPIPPHSIPILMADTMAPLFVNVADSDQAARVRVAINGLKRPGGLMANERTDSTHQWDGNNGWAPQQVMAMQGLMNYGYEADAQDLGWRWVRLVSKVQDDTGVMFERYDVANESAPAVDRTKYPVQPGFLWTNASYVWTMTNVLGINPTHN